MSALRQAIAAAVIGPLLRREDGAWCQACRFDSACVAFAGHFPGNPLLPALAQILAGEHVAQAIAGRQLVLTGVERARFLLPIVPEQTVDVVVREPATSGRSCWEVRLLTDAGQAASFLLTFDPAPAPVL